MKNAILSFVFLTIIGCSNDNEQQIEPTQIETQMLWKGLFNPDLGAQQQNSIFTNNDDWQEFINSLPANYQSQFNSVQVDFTSNDIIGIIDQGYPTYGYSIDIVSVLEYRDQVIVDIENLNQGGVLQATCQPYHFAKIQKLNKPVQFE